VRILLGVAEAGFFPGIILYLTYWFPARERARMMAWFMVAIGGASVISNPASGAIMQYLDGAAGLEGWQWLFLLEGIPSVLLGFVVLVLLPDGPEQARWLTDEERQRLLEELQQEEHVRHRRHGAPSLRALLEWRVALLTIVYFTVALGANASGAHFPRLIRQHFPDRDTFNIGLLAAVPHLCAILGMTFFAAHSDRTGERRGHVAFAAWLGAAGWLLADSASDPWLFMVGLCIAQTGMMCMLPTFWTLPTMFLGGTAAAGGIALINSLGNIGGLVAPNMLSAFGGAAIGWVLVAGGALVLCLRDERGAEQR
jgi:ACS family tartrate transporter-like MFS transporter